MSTLARRTYDLLQTVPTGRVTTYKALAEALGTKAYRAIGQFMRHNPDAPAIPCHRVVSSNGSIGGFMGKRNGAAVAQKLKLLAKEGVTVQDNRIVNFKQVCYPLSPHSP